jgi:hypothetical protein
MNEKTYRPVFKANWKSYEEGFCMNFMAISVLRINAQTPGVQTLWALRVETIDSVHIYHSLLT